ncbi:hypothetical protein [Vibrio nereis]|uniref:Rod shape-determining protein MreB n=1 Tax=Vibrio nereis TaxID=693 RepID=A0A0M0HIH5_VIBNE|nr:hypothetical protein [Vibrio nereis]KOO01870.1 hypothetical protein AKJ17_18325 [Vibrio nereis]
MFSKRHVYFQVVKGKVTGRNLETGECAVELCEGLSHPRTLMGDFFLIESSFQNIIDKLAPKKPLLRTPILFIHLIPTAEGGYTNVELRAFKEVGLGIGSIKVYLIVGGAELSKEQLLQGEFHEWPSAT